MTISIISLAISAFSFLCAGFSIYKVYKLHKLFKSEDITSEEDNNVYIKNNSF